MYFANFPVIPYDSVGNGDYKLVTNLLKRVAVRAKVKTNTALFDTYNVKEGQTPEMIADKLYGDPNLHWIIMYVNNITDRYHQWPMTTPQFLAFLNDKYSDPDGFHHWETAQTSGDTTVMINIGTDRTGMRDSTFTIVTNREFEEKRQDTLRKIRLLDPAYVDQFVEEFENLIGASVL
tara:strand:- start:1586 stop:2119 length:534 start_codon:yes stop_codon:yes gene_type:complete